MKKTVVDSNLSEILTSVVKFYRGKYGNRLEQVWLFGSKARGDDTHDSDVDIMIVVDDNAHIERGLGKNPDGTTFAREILAKYDEMIILKIYPISDFQSDSIPLHRNVKKDGILYYEKE